ncbi:MAG: ABC transporter permease subunit [Dehalococcoidia bacterium]|nr:ABC transporter permease subunit [Dehalococcoidia bacterium]
MSVSASRTTKQRQLWRAYPRLSMKLINPLLPLLSFVGVIVLWDLATRLDLVSEGVISTPANVWDRAVLEFERGKVIDDCLATGRSLGQGLLFAVLIGAPVGLIIGRWRPGWLFTEWPLIVLNGIPTVALSPVLILLFGIGIEGKIFIAAIAASIPIIWNGAAGSRSTPLVLLNVGLTYGCNRITFLTKVVAPHSLPYLMTGIRLGMSRAFVAVLVAELYVGHAGLGSWLRLAITALSPDLLMFVTILSALVGIAFISIVGLAERAFSGWKEG